MCFLCLSTNYRQASSVVLLLRGYPACSQAPLGGACLQKKIVYKMLIKTAFHLNCSILEVHCSYNKWQSGRNLMAEGQIKIRLNKSRGQVYRQPDSSAVPWKAMFAPRAASLDEGTFCWRIACWSIACSLITSRCHNVRSMILQKRCLALSVWTSHIMLIVGRQKTATLKFYFIVLWSSKQE